MKKTLLFLACLYSQTQATTIRVKDLSYKSIEALREYQQNNPGPLTIKIEGERTVFDTVVGWGEWASETADTATGELDKWGMAKPILKWALGGAFMSYGATFYVIYRAYKLLKTIGSWSNSVGQSNDEELMLYVRQLDKTIIRQKYLQEIKREKTVLELYLKMHKHLCRWHIRKVFPYDETVHRSIVKSFERLCALEQHLCGIIK
ncbi:MAG: hypothetical protein ACJAZS_000274 [Alteromonas naphthalenivorans]|jgi:hypothetical protein